jgi:hypothetical protein
MNVHPGMIEQNAGAVYETVWGCCMRAPAIFYKPLVTNVK